MRQHLGSKKLHENLSHTLVLTETKEVQLLLLRKKILCQIKHAHVQNNIKYRLE